MDSLLVILAVIGVVMILAGIARMKSKKKHSWDDIDHSVLFTKNDDQKKEKADVEEGVVSAPRIIAKKDDEELSEEEEFEFLDNLLKEKKDEGGSASNVSVKIDDDEHPSESIQNEPEKAASKPRSLFDKLRSAATDSADDVDDDEDLLDPCYREGAPEKVIVLNVMAPQGTHFTGAAIADVAKNNGLIFGDMNIFHLQRGKEHVFSVVNMVKPGVFDMNNIDSMTTPGVSLFIQLPNNLGNCVSAFDTMLETGQSFATTLGGELRDETRSVLTQNAIDHVREQMIEYDCKWLVH